MNYAATTQLRLTFRRGWQHYNKLADLPRILSGFGSVKRRVISEVLKNGNSGFNLTREDFA